MKVQIVADEHDHEQKKKMEEEAEERRTKNALPEWVLRSTISGEITAIGHRNQSITERKAKEDAVSNNQTDGHDTLNVDQYYNDYYTNFNALKRSQSPTHEVSSNKRIKHEDTAATGAAQTTQAQPSLADESDEEDDDFEQVA